LGNPGSREERAGMVFENRLWEKADRFKEILLQLQTLDSKMVKL